MTAGAVRPEDVDRIVAAFESTYSRVYPEAGYVVSDVHLPAVVPKASPRLAEHPPLGPAAADSTLVETRRVFHRDHWREFPVWQMKARAAGNAVSDPMTTGVIPEGHEIAFDSRRVTYYRAA